MNMEISDVSHRTADGVEIEILVSPRSGRSGPDGFDEWRKRLIIRVKAPPLDGKANKEVEALFTELTGNRSEIKNGHMNRQKTVLIRGDQDAIMNNLEGSI